MNLYPRDQLSAWDTLSVDEQGRPMNGFGEESPLGYNAQAILDMLYISHAKAGDWQLQHPWGQNVISVIRKGAAVTGDVHYAVRRGPRDGIMFAAWHLESRRLKGMVGITVTAQDSSGRWIGVLRGDINELQKTLVEWAKTNSIPAPFATIDFSQALRFNQGDRFTAGGSGMAIPVTIPGYAEQPLVASILSAPPEHEPQV